MFIDLLYQVKNLLGLGHGGTGNRHGLSRGVIFRALNGLGASIAVGSTVKRAAYNHAVVIPTTTTDEQVLGVTVGNMGAGDAIDEATATPANGIVAVATSGVVDVLLGADVTAGQYAFAHATDGTAYSSATASPDAFGIFLSSGTTGSKARVHLTPQSPGTVSDADLAAHTGDALDAHDASAVSITDAGGYFTGTDVEAALAEVATGTTGRWEVLMTPGITSPPEPLTNEAGDDELVAWISG